MLRIKSCVVYCVAACDPRMWNKDDVLAFLRWCEIEFDLPHFDIDLFQMNGEYLTSHKHVHTMIVYRIRKNCLLFSYKFLICSKLQQKRSYYLVSLL